MKKRIVSLLLALVMVLSLVPTTVWAAENHDGQVRVIVENTTYAKADGAAWDGTLVDKWVDLVPGSTMMDCIVSALGSYSQTGADSGYITEINGLTAGDGGEASGWMGTLNDWFTNVGFKDIKAGDKLFAGDVIRVMYTVNGYGADIGGDWNTQSDTSLAALSFSEGVLTPDFASDKTAYTLTLPQGVTGIRMTATASNKNNQVYLSADGTDYRRVETVPVHNGTVLTIRCGDKAAATEWSPAITPTTYTVTVSQEGDAPQGDLDVSFKGLHSAQLASLKLYDFADGVKGDRDLLANVTPETAEGYSYDLTGTIRVGGFGGIPTHRGVSYRSGMDRQYGSATAAVLTRLPELVLPLTGWYVHDVEQKIAAIGTVTLDSEEAIQAARAAYDALSDQRKAQVSNYDVLLAAEKKLAQLQDEAVAHVEELIDAIGQPVIPASRAAVEAARAAYNALGQKLQERVGNYDVLLAAEARLAELNAQDIYKTTGDFIVSKGAPVTGSIGGEWAVLGLARSGRDVPGADAYYASVVEYVQKAMDENGRLNRSRSTENSRLILALTAIGKDVTHVAGRSLLDGLDSMAFITKQSVNGPVWALLALDSHGYPTSGDVTREKLVRAILDTQREDGSWPVIASSQVPDVDMTAMAIQALAPYYENAQVKAAVDAALTFLAGVQNADGTFSEIPGTDASAESTAQVIVALTALGIDPTADSRFVKSGVSVVDALCGFYVTGGGFRHLMADKTVDGMATEQGYYALAAYYRLTAGKTSLYDMSDVTITVTPDQPAKPDAPRTGDESPVLVWMGMAALAGAAVLLMQNKKKRA